VSKKQEVPADVSDEEIDHFFRNTNFGRKDYRHFLALSVLKTALDYHCGHTITEIMIGMDLITKARSVTLRGRSFCYAELEGKPDYSA
jgi:hypothetical protein